MTAALAYGPASGLVGRGPHRQYRRMERRPGEVGEELAALMEAVALRHDRAAFATLFDRLAPRVKSYLMRLGLDAAVAEELTQEVMLIVWRRAASFDRRLAGVGTWVFTIARNKRIDALRRGAHPEIERDDPALVPAPEAAPDERTDAGQWERRLAAAIAELPQEQASLLRQSFFDDRSHSEIARSSSLPLGTVKSRLRLAMARLRQAFKDEPR